MIDDKIIRMADLTVLEVLWGDSGTSFVHCALTCTWLQLATVTKGPPKMMPYIRLVLWWPREEGNYWHKRVQITADNESLNSLSITAAWHSCTRRSQQHHQLMAPQTSKVTQTTQVGVINKMLLNKCNETTPLSEGVDTVNVVMATLSGYDQTTH